MTERRVKGGGRTRDGEWWERVKGGEKGKGQGWE